jgi:hypothetical protein
MARRMEPISPVYPSVAVVAIDYFVLRQLQLQMSQPFRGPRMGSAGVDHQVGVEGARLPVVTRENFDTRAVAMSLARGAERGHLSALKNGNLVQTPAELEDG